jgi:head-tail adaptor
MTVGKMYYSVVIEKPVNPDARRGEKTEWETVATVWASIKQKVSRETNSNNQIVMLGDYEIKLWTIADLDETWRAKHGNEVYNFVSIDNPNWLRGQTVITAKRNKLVGA